MFDLINGLPVHPLVVHAAVVLVPLTLVGAILIVIRRKWRKSLGWWVVGLAALSVFFSVVAKESGEALAGRIGEPETHASLGDTMPLVSGVMFLFVLIVVAADRLLDRGEPATDGGGDAPPARTPVLVTVLGIVAIVACVGATYQVYRVGDSGAQAAWADVVAGTTQGVAEDEPAPAAQAAASATPTPSSTASPHQGPKVLTMSQVERHSGAADCWTAIAGVVYDLTPWETEHPGGIQPILGLCGTDGTAAFDAQHGGQGKPEQELAQFKIGVLA